VSTVKLPKPISFNWDKGNITKNWDRHKINQKECEEIFFNRELILLKDIKHSQKEARYIALGVTRDRKKLHIVFTIRNLNIRIISARNQSKKERKLYEKR